MADIQIEALATYIAQERKLAIIINMPFNKGGLFKRVKGKPLPGWASEIDCQNWAQFFLKFIISHPAVTVTTPATSRIDHMQENISALLGHLPDTDMRSRMIKYFNNQ